MAKVIQVVPDTKKTWKVLVDYIQRGVSYHSSALANQEAIKYHNKVSPHASLSLYSSEN